MEAFPERKRLGALWDVLSADQFAAAEREAKARQLTLRAIKMENPPYDFDSAFRALTQDGVDMLHVLGSPLFSAQYERIAELGIQYRLPQIHILRHYVDGGGLMSYGVNFIPMMRRVVSFVAKILRGVKPADAARAGHPIRVVVNLKTAKAMGVTLPTSILLRADEVIE